MRKSTLLLVIVLALAVALSGCLVKSKPGQPTTIAVNPEDVTINLASGFFTAKLSASIKDEKNNTIKVEGDDIEWAVADTDVVVLANNKGETVTIEAKKIGETKVTVKYGALDPVEIPVKVIDEEIIPETGYKAPKVVFPLKVGEEWPVKDENAYSFFTDEYDGEEVGWKVWVFWDDDNVYIQYDVYTDLPFGNKKTERYIFEADSLEWEIRTPDESLRQKWMIALTEEKGHEVVIRYPDREYYVAPNDHMDVKIEETDFGYRGQVVLSQAHEKLAEFSIELGLKLEMAVQVNDSDDGETRTRILGGFVDSGEYTELWFLYK